MATTDSAREPLRTCIGCRRRLPQSRLVRCVRNSGRPLVSRTAPGRGAWLCSDDCFDAAVRRRAFGRAWRADADPHTLATLRIAFHAVISNMTDSSIGRSRPAPAVPTKG